MTAYSMTTAGNYSASATWGGVDPATFVPGTDTLTVPATITGALVLDTSTTIPAMTIEDEVYGVVQATGVTTTLGGIMTLGNGSAKDGKFTFGAGATLDIGAFGIVQNNSAWDSNATSSSWATLVGSGSISRGAIYGTPKCQCDLLDGYVSFQNTGGLVIASAGTSGAVTNRINISHCAFYTNGSINLGVGGSAGNLTSPYYICENDFILSGTLTVVGSSGTTTASTTIQKNTFASNSATYRQVKILYRSGAVFTDNVLVDTNVWPSSVATPVVKRNAFIARNDPGSTTFIIMGADAAVGSYSDNYIYSRDYTYVHQTSSSGSGGTGDIEISGNVFEPGQYTDVLLAGSINKNITKNIALNGNLIGWEGANALFAMSQNTIYTANPTEAFLVLAALTANTATPYPSLLNNLIVNTGATTAVPLITNFTAGSTVTFSTVDYNYCKGLTFANRYTSTGPITITTGSSNDVDFTGDPRFVDPTRALATWDATNGSGAGNSAGAIEYLLKINGFNPTTKTQSDTPSANTVATAITGLVPWVRAGFAPQNSALAAAGYGGTYIGAMDVYVPPVVSGGIIGPMHLGLGLSLN